MRRPGTREAVTVNYDETTKGIVYKVLIIGLLLELLIYSIFSVEWGDVVSIEQTAEWTREVGSTIFNQYGVAVVMMGLLLLSAIIGGVFLAQEDDDE